MANVDSSSVFSKLYSLISQRQDSGRNCEEDFLTEIIASVLSLNNNAGYFFSNLLGISDDQYKVSTQEIKEKLEEHDDASRIDMVAWGEKTVIYVENKIASGEGTDHAGERDQLKKYADHLERESQDKKFLLYITKWFDPKDEMRAYCAAKGAKFYQPRWFEVYQALQQLMKNTGMDPIIQQTLKFMEEKNTAPRRNFSPMHLLAIQNIQEAESLMRDSVSGKVAKRISEITGAGPAERSSDNAFWSSAKLDGTHGGELGVHYWQEKSKDYPFIGVWIQYWSDDKKEPIEKEMRNLAEKFKDEGFYYEAEEKRKRYGAWVECTKSLKDYLGNNDNVAAIEEHLLKQLDRFDPIWKMIAKNQK